MIWIFGGVGVGVLLGWILGSADDLTPVVLGSLVGWFVGCVIHLKRSKQETLEAATPEPAPEPTKPSLPATLLAEFRKSLLSRHEALTVALPAFEAGDPAALARIRHLAHQLRGTGLSYGLPEVSEAAATVEDAPPDELAPPLRELLVVLELAAQTLAPSAPLARAPLEWMTREEFVQAYRRATELAATRGNSLTLGLVRFRDLDRIEDEHGQELAERVRRYALSYLSATIEGTDLVACWSDSEVVILLKAASGTAARGLLARLEGALAQEVFQAHGGVRVQPKIDWSADAVDLRRELPAALGALTAEGSAPSERLAVAPSSGTGTILLVDDDQTLADFVCFKLREHGFEVVHVSDGVAALERVLDLKPDLCLVDVHMPGIDGFEVLERLRAEPIALTVPIVMLTAAGREVDTLRGFELGASDYVIKPFVPGVLLARIQRLLEAVR